MLKTLYRVTYYTDKNAETQALVVAETAAEAATFLGLSQWQSAAEVARNVEVAGVDKPHEKIAPKEPDIMPPAPEQLTPDDIKKLKALVAKAPATK
jgi:hypothetical protein